MPSDDGLGLDEEQGLLPVGPEAQQAHPKQPVGGPEFGFGRLPFEHCELMSERQVFEHEPGMGLETGEQRAEKRPNDLKHNEANFGRRDGNLSVFERLRDFRYPQPLPGSRLQAVMINLDRSPFPDHAAGPSNGEQQ
jgi:hypothetical protein